MYYYQTKVIGKYLQSLLPTWLSSFGVLLLRVDCFHLFWLKQHAFESNLHYTQQY